MRSCCFPFSCKSTLLGPFFLSRSLRCRYFPFCWPFGLSDREKKLPCLDWMFDIVTHLIDKELFHSISLYIEELIALFFVWVTDDILLFPYSWKVYLLLLFSLIVLTWHFIYFVNVAILSIMSMGARNTFFNLSKIDFTV